MMRRKLDYRPTWTLNTTEHASANYYPVNTAIAVQDETTERQLQQQDSYENESTRQAKKPLRLVVVTDRSQGGSSLREGEVELML